MPRRTIIRIDADRCTGCGKCLVACAESALRLVDGKARLVRAAFCDGLGACLGECPEGAIALEEREAEAFDEQAVRAHLVAAWADGEGAVPGCPSTRQAVPSPPAASSRGASHAGGEAASRGQWPLKLRLVAPDAPFLKGADLALVADCVAFAAAPLGDPRLSGGALLIGCPKFDDWDGSLQRLAQILSAAGARSLTAVHMEVPCCSGYWHLARQACQLSGRDVTLRRLVVGVGGQVVEPATREGATP